jgi:hypothetical protein
MLVIESEDIVVDGKVSEDAMLSTAKRTKALGPWWLPKVGEETSLTSWREFRLLRDTFT